MQGLSFRLKPYEDCTVHEFTINLKPRKNYGVEMEKKLTENYAQSRMQHHDRNIKNEQA